MERMNNGESEFYSELFSKLCAFLQHSDILISYLYSPIHAITILRIQYVPGNVPF